MSEVKSIGKVIRTLNPPKLRSSLPPKEGAEYMKLHALNRRKKAIDNEMEIWKKKHESLMLETKRVQMDINEIEMKLRGEVNTVVEYQKMPKVKTESKGKNVKVIEIQY